MQIDFFLNFFFLWMCAQGLLDVEFCIFITAWWFFVNVFHYDLNVSATRKGLSYWFLWGLLVLIFFLSLSLKPFPMYVSLPRLPYYNCFCEIIAWRRRWEILETEKSIPEVINQAPNAEKYCSSTAWAVGHTQNASNVYLTKLGLSLELHISSWYDYSFFFKFNAVMFMLT